HNRRHSVTERLGDTSTSEFHSPSGYLARETDAAGNTTSYSYTAQTQGGFTYYVRTGIQYADGATIALAYDNNGNVLTATDAAGKVTRFTYNSRGQVLTATNAAGGVVTNTFNADGTLATSPDPCGNGTTYTDDAKKHP